MRSMWLRLLVMLGILGGAHLYIWWRLVAPLPSPWFEIGTALIAILGPSLPFMFRRSKWVQLVGYLWFGLAVYLLLGAWGSHIAVAFGASARTAAAVAALAALATVALGLLHVARGPQVKRVVVPLAKLGRDEYRVVQLTDVHIGTMLRREFAERVVRQVNELEPDLVVITGDFVDGPLSVLQPHVEPFRGLRARDGVYAVTGNHEYYWNAELWLEHLRSLGITILRNEHVTIGGAFQLAGVDDSSAGEDVPRAVRGRNPALPMVLLAHHPRTVERAAAAGVDLQLSGHTHGGQLLPLGWLVRLFEPQAAGLGRHGPTQLYVSEGTGYWGPPLRVGTTQEITLLTLRRPA
jgi:predicted MPP superfamily phosphohydrolase